jgi:predicted metal-dependent hydrolase
VSHKREKIASLIHSLQGREFDAHYLGYFACFNQQLFFEAHDVLEELWLAQRGQPKDLFYKGLIQLAGAFVHIQKKRSQPAIALFKLAAGNLSKYPNSFESLDLGQIQNLIRLWMARLELDAQFSTTLELVPWPNLSLGKR